MSKNRRPDKILFLLMLCLAFMLTGRTVSAEGMLEPRNILKIKNITSDNKPLKGFRYELSELETGVVIYIDLTKSNIYEAELPNGHYVLKETLTPEPYMTGKDISFMLPYTQNNTSTAFLTIEPKHIPKDPVITTAEPVITTETPTTVTTKPETPVTTETTTEETTTEPVITTEPEVSTEEPVVTSEETTISTEMTTENPSTETTVSTISETTSETPEITTITSEEHTPKDPNKFGPTGLGLMNLTPVTAYLLTALYLTLKPSKKSENNEK